MTVYFSHATGFCAAVWNPVRTKLDDVDTVAWDHPGHGTGPQLEPPIDWRIFGEYVLDHTNPGGIGVGHSMGAAALAMAQVADPQRFKALVLVEPIMYPGPFARREDPMSEQAQRRRPEFKSRAEAADSFRGRGAFEGWDAAAFDAYIECGLIGEDPVRLACAPEVEADIYRGAHAHDTWDRVGAIDIPVLLMAGEMSDTMTPAFVRDQAAQFQRAGVEMVAGVTHFLPMQNPGVVADRVRRFVEMVGA